MFRVNNNLGKPPVYLKLLLVIINHMHLFTQEALEGKMSIYHELSDPHQYNISSNMMILCDSWFLNKSETPPCCQDIMIQDRPTDTVVCKDGIDFGQIS